MIYKLRQSYASWQATHEAGKTSLVLVAWPSS